jgi:hypothetical protein
MAEQGSNTTSGMIVVNAKSFTLTILMADGTYSFLFDQQGVPIIKCDAISAKQMALKVAIFVGDLVLSISLLDGILVCRIVESTFLL